MKSHTLPLHLLSTIKSGLSRSRQFNHPCHLLCPKTLHWYSTSLSVSRESPPALRGGTDSQIAFEHLGLPKAVFTALQEAFPSVRYPTKTQQLLIPAVSGGKDVFLQDHTGTGKSFGLLLALLSKQRRTTFQGEAGPKAPRAAPITSLVIVPHRDLAYQFLHWTKRMHERMPQTDDLSSIVQVLVRNALTPLHTQVSTLRSQPPHILIGTPQALTDALKEDESILQLDNLSTVVVDEADYLLPYIPRTADKHAKLKAERMMRKHPDPTRLILDKIFTPSRLPSDNKQRVKILEQIGTQSGGIHRPQLILSSATFRVHFRNWLMRESGWLTMDKNKLVKIKGDLQTRENALNEAESEGGSVLRTDNIQYYALIVSAEGKIINIEGATEPATTNEVLIGNVEDITDTVQSTSTPASDALIMESQVVKPLPFNSTTLEAISEIFALDVPRLALLVLPASAPLRQVVAELCDYGVNAHSLDVFQKETGGAYLNQGSPDLAVDDPTLLVSTLASIRGLDLPELTHVFILGVPEDRPVDSYLHAAGRVGRFGRNGKVISVLKARQEIEKEGGKKVWKDEPGKMQKMFAKTGIRPTKMDHFA